MKILGFLLLGVFMFAPLNAAIAESAPDFASGKILLLGTAAGSLVINVEFAKTEAERRHGLMYRDTLAPRTGMLFIFGAEAIRSFWMKNTLIALDMVFFDGKGNFVSAQHNVPPLTLVARRSAAPAQFVLELNAGEVAALGINAQTSLVLPSSQ